MVQERIASVVNVYKRNIAPVILTDIKSIILSMGGLYYSTRGDVRIGLETGIALIVGYLIFNFFYGFVNSYIVIYAHKFGLHMRKNPDLSVKEGLKGVSDIKELLKDGTIYLIIITAISVITGVIVGSILGAGFIGVVVTLIELSGIVGLLSFGVITFLVLGASSIITKGITDSILVYILIHKKKDVKGSITFIKNNFIRFGLIDTAYSFIKLIALIFANAVGITLIMPMALEWKYDHWVRDVPEF